ncbi:unnamed protein product [Paramecium primaurelia]|uniref:Uncharacterized protein n=1 Tax=Paramecium primaurelia TaxID=5886 RepID=A0A8S1N7D0_PARPR|nr:unnamed protein product [Paramecium primaurelia]
MKNFLEKHISNDYSIRMNNLSQNHEYQLNQYKCSSPIVFGNRFASPSPFRSVTPIQGQLSPANQSRRESAFSRNSDNYDFSVKEKSKILNKPITQYYKKQQDQQDEEECNIDYFFDKEQIIIEEQELLHAKLRMIRDDFNFKIQQLEDFLREYLRERQSILQNLSISIKEEQDRYNEQSKQNKRKNKQNEIHARTDSINKQDSKSDSQPIQQEIIRAASSMKEQRTEFNYEKRDCFDIRRESRHESINGYSSHHRRESSYKTVKLRESRVKREESLKGDSVKEEQPLKSALKKKDSNRQTYNCQDDSQDDWKFIKEAKNNLEKQKTQLDDKQSPNKVRFVNQEKSQKKQQDKVVKSKYLNDIDIFLKCRY